MRGPGLLELAPEALFGLAPLRRDAGQVDDDAAVEQVVAGDDLLDAVEHHRPLHVEDRLVLVGVELPRGEPAAGADAAERIRLPVLEMAEVVEGQAPAVGGRDHQVALVPRQGADRRLVRVDRGRAAPAAACSWRSPARRARPGPGRDHAAGRRRSTRRPTRIHAASSPSSPVTGGAH